jgi:hypothetical protein
MSINIKTFQESLLRRHQREIGYEDAEGQQHHKNHLAIATEAERIDGTGTNNS